MDIADIHFHDSRILRVTEDTTTDTLVMEIDYPVDWANDQFEPRHLIFLGACNYQVFESPFYGPPTMLSAGILETSGAQSRLRIETNAGYREVSYGSVELRIIEQ